MALENSHLSDSPDHSDSAFSGKAIQAEATRREILATDLVGKIVNFLWGRDEAGEPESHTGTVAFKLGEGAKTVFYITPDKPSDPVLSDGKKTQNNKVCLGIEAIEAHNPVKIIF